MSNNVVLQSALIILLFGLGGGVGALIARLVYGLKNRVKEADVELEKARSIQRRIYQIAIGALRGMKQTQTMDIYKANFRAFRDAITDAETLQMDSVGIWRAQALVDTLNYRQLPDEETLTRIDKTEEDLIKDLNALIDEEEKKTKKQKPKKQPAQKSTKSQSKSKK